MNGLLLVDKPGGMTSFEVVRRVRRWCATRQVGHCGTLDPGATGVLPVAVGSATRLVEYLMAGDKEYFATLRLGVTTDTQDGEGQVLATRPVQGVDRATLLAAATELVGEIDQVPPMHSALKRDGVPLYRLARQGMTVERAPRRIRVDTLEVLAVDLPEVTIRIACGKGTYVRTLCHDLGEKLGCGAHMTALRRTRCGFFRVEQCHPLAELAALAEDGRPLPLLSLADALPDWPGYEVLGDAVRRLSNGVSPLDDETAGAGSPVDGQLARLLVGGELAALARRMPVADGQPARAWRLLKVFPEAFAAAGDGLKSFTPSDKCDM